MNREILLALMAAIIDSGDAGSIVACVDRAESILDNIEQYRSEEFPDWTGKLLTKHRFRESVMSPLNCRECGMGDNHPIHENRDTSEPLAGLDYSDPIVSMPKHQDWAHAFKEVPGNRFCGLCGGGRLHEIHGGKPDAR